MIPRPPIIIRTATLFPCTALVLSFFVCPWVRALLRIYIEVLRTTPFLIQLFVLYYGGPSVGIELSAMTAGVVALAFYGSAYFAEAFRSGFALVPRWHVEAAQDGKRAVGGKSGDVGVGVGGGRDIKKKK